MRLLMASKTMVKDERISFRDQALKAIDVSDWQTVEEMGMGGFFTLLATSYPPARGGKHRTAMAPEMRAFVQMLYRWEPSRWLDALMEWQGGSDGSSRPYPGQIRGVITQASNPVERSADRFAEIERLIEECGDFDDIPAGDPHLRLAVDYCLKRDLPVSEAVTVRKQMVNRWI